MARPAHSPRTPLERASQLRRVAFVRARPRREPTRPPFPVGLLSLAAATRERGYADVHLVDLRAEGLDTEGAAQRLVALDPDVVGISAMSAESGNLHAVAREVRRRLPRALVVAGGPYASLAAADALADPNVDLVVRGEAEESFPDLLDAWNDGRREWAGFAGLSWRDARGRVVHEPDRAPPADLDRLPPPAWDLAVATAPDERGAAALFTSRACPPLCSFCHHSYGATFRARSVSSVLDEIDRHVRMRGARRIELLDDVFNFDAARAKAIARGLIEAGHGLWLTFPNGLRSDRLDEELLDLLRRAGMRRCTLDVGSASPRVQRAMRKNLKLERVRRVAELAVERGLHVHGTFLLGTPGESAAERRATIDWAARSPFHTAEFALASGDASAASVRAARKRAYRAFYARPARLWRILRLSPPKLDVERLVKRTMDLSRTRLPSRARPMRHTFEQR